MLAKRLTLTLLLAVGALAAQAQTDTLLLRDFLLVKQSEAWLTADNAAWLTRYTLAPAARAELSLTDARGGLTDFNGSPSVMQADAEVEAFQRLNSRTVVYGAMSYSNFTGHRMAGSAFMPLSQLSTLNSQLTTHLPFDIIEDSLTNTGRKHSDTYRLSGAVGTTLWRGVAAGLRLDYTAANYAKYKDLRHKNKLMDLRLTAGLYVPLGRHVQLGLDYQYHRSTESLTFSTYGKGDRVYNSFINYGPYIGQVEQFGATGYTDKSRTQPLVSDADGAGFQLNLQPADGWQLYQQTAYARRRGYYGRPSPYTITYTRHRSHQYRYDVRLTHQTQSGSRFSLDLSLQAENLRNDARTYREQQNDAGATYYEYYTPVKTADRLWVDGTVSLTAHLLPLRGMGDNFSPQGGAVGALTLQAGMDWQHRHQTAYLFPYARRQRLTAREWFVSVCRRFITSRGVWSVTLDASFREGHGQPYDDFTLAEPSDKQTEPATMQAYLWREWQWLTAAQYSVGGEVKYSFLLPATRLKTYVGARLHHRKANEQYDFSAGRDRTQATVAIGCEF